MAWDVRKLREKIWRLELKLNSVTDPKEREALSLELINLKTMVNYKVDDTIYEDLVYKPEIFDLNHFANQAQVIKETGADYSFSMYPVMHLHHVPVHIVRQKILTSKEYQKTLTDFLAYFDQNLLDLYLRFKEENRIEINKRPFDTRSCRGVCHPSLSDASSYISSRDDCRTKYITNIPHELAHAFQFEGESDIVVIQKMLYSLFAEAYPIFVEYAFLDYLKSTKYSRQALALEGETINNYICLLDYSLTSFKDMATNGLISQNQTSIISNMVAMYWYSLYRKDKSLAKDEVDDFNKRFGYVYESDFLEIYDPEILSEGAKETINNYMKDYRQSR